VSPRRRGRGPRRQRRAWSEGPGCPSQRHRTDRSSPAGQGPPPAAPGAVRRTRVPERAPQNRPVIAGGAGAPAGSAGRGPKDPGARASATEPTGHRRRGRGPRRQRRAWSEGPGCPSERHRTDRSSPAGQGPPPAAPGVVRSTRVPERAPQNRPVIAGGAGAPAGSAGRGPKDPGARASATEPTGHRRRGRGPRRQRRAWSEGPGCPSAKKLCFATNWLDNSNLWSLPHEVRRGTQVWNRAERGR